MLNFTQVREELFRRYISNKFGFKKHSKSSKAIDRTLTQMLIPFLRQTCEGGWKDPVQHEVIDILKLHYNLEDIQIVPGVYCPVIPVQTGKLEF